MKQVRHLNSSRCLLDIDVSRNILYDGVWKRYRKLQEQKEKKTTEEQQDRREQEVENMNKNPYDVLGVSPEATDDEIKKAYRELSRKYHPDANVDNPLKDLAEEKFKEVQEAYDTIVKERENGGGYHYGYGNAGSYTTGSGSYGNSGYGGAGSTTSVERQAVYKFINNRRYQEALNLLNRLEDRNAEWYYFSAAANARRWETMSLHRSMQQKQ